MATGWAGDGAVQDQIDATIDDAVKRARAGLPKRAMRVFRRHDARPCRAYACASPARRNVTATPSRPADTTAAAARTASCVRRSVSDRWADSPVAVTRSHVGQEPWNAPWAWLGRMNLDSGLSVPFSRRKPGPDAFRPPPLGRAHRPWRIPQRREGGRTPGAVRVRHDVADMAPNLLLLDHTPFPRKDPT